VGRRRQSGGGRAVPPTQPTSRGRRARSFRGPPSPGGAGAQIFETGLASTTRPQVTLDLHHLTHSRWLELSKKIIFFSQIRTSACARYPGSISADFADFRYVSDVRGRQSAAESAAESTAAAASAATSGAPASAGAGASPAVSGAPPSTPASPAPASAAPASLGAPSPPPSPAMPPSGGGKSRPWQVPGAIRPPVTATCRLEVMTGWKTYSLGAPASGAAVRM